MPKYVVFTQIYVLLSVLFRAQNDNGASSARPPRPGGRDQKDVDCRTKTPWYDPQHKNYVDLQHQQRQV